MSRKETKALDMYFVALYVYDTADLVLEVPDGFAVRELKFDGDRFSTGDWVVIPVPNWNAVKPGVYGWKYEEPVAFKVVSGKVLITMKQGQGVGKDPWPPPPPPPPPFAADPVAVKRWPVHACAHHEELYRQDGSAVESELFIPGIGG
jgi:hypothetical protein